MNYSFYTYENGRCCKHCGAPIADQLHAARQFCERAVLEDGSIRNCKDDYHIEVRRNSDGPFREQVRVQKEQNRRIEALFKQEGAKVTREMLNRAGIILQSAMYTELKDGRWHLGFGHYSIEQLSSTQFKIYPHDHSVL